MTSMRSLILVAFLVLISSTHAFDNFKLNQDQLETQNQLKGVDIVGESPLYGEILNYLQIHSDSIAQRQLRIVDEGRNLSVWGGMNHVGINFSKGFGTFSIELKREVAPDLFDDHRWLVTDTFDIYIDASQVLNQLKNDEVIDISEKNLAAFAGLTFKRSYTQVHFADSYQRALGFNLDKLFFSFRNFRNLEALEIGPNEFIKQEDSFSLQAGGVATAPLTTGLGAHVGALLKYRKMSTTTLLGVAEEDQSFPGERVRISVEKEKGLDIGATGGLVADFMGVLQVTLLKFDFSYHLSESFKTYLAFTHDQIDNLEESGTLADELRNIFRAKNFNRDVVAPYLISEEQRKKENMDFRYSVLLFGATRSNQTEHIQITKDDIHKSFFRHNFEKTWHIENLFSRLFNIVVKSFLKLNSVVNKAITESRIVRLEYQSEKNLIQTQDDLIFEEGNEKLSLNFNRDFYSYKFKKISKKRLSSLMNNYSGIDPQVIGRVENGDLNQSINFSSFYSLGHDAMIHFHNLSVAQAYDIFDRACSSSKRSFFARLFKTCERRLKRAFDKYDKEWRVKDYTSATYKNCEKSFKDYKRRKFWISSRRKRLFLDSCMQVSSQKSITQRNKELPLWQLAKLSQQLQKRLPSKTYYFDLFGYKNVHVHGEISGLDKNGFQFQHYYREGIFKGTGIVNNYKKSAGLRAPASTTSP